MDVFFSIGLVGKTKKRKFFSGLANDAVSFFSTNLVIAK
jgi:hypothetical protein